MLLTINFVKSCYEFSLDTLVLKVHPPGLEPGTSRV
ncbi:MAG: hypothetical protein RI935_779 [Candidatus Parcubacteria bacterium]